MGLLESRTRYTSRMVSIEYEIKVLDVDESIVKQKLKNLGAIYIDSYKYRRYIFELPSKNKDEWLRLRTNGEQSTLTYKNSRSNTISGTEEIEIIVESFERAKDLLIRSGFNPVSYQENDRELYMLGKIELCIDKWPLIPAYLEIEGPNEKSVTKVLKSLKLDEFQTTSESTARVYERYGLNLNNYKYLSHDN